VEQHLHPLPGEEDGQNGKHGAGAAAPVAGKYAGVPVKHLREGADGKSKVCKKCGLLLTLDQFPVNVDCSRDGHEGTCRACRKARQAEMALKRLKEKGMALRRAHPMGADPAIITKELHCLPCGKSFATKCVFDQHREKCGAV
jgi:hypothetical protein